MNFIISKKSKQGLASKAKARSKTLTHQSSMAGISASLPNDLLPDLLLERRGIATLKDLPKRVRTSEAAQIERIAKSLRSLRQTMPILIASDGTIINGHLVAQAMKSLGVSEIWCVVADHLGEDERAMVHVALNRIGETGDWDFEGLGSLLVELDDIGFDLEVTGFTVPEIDILTTACVDTDEGNDEPDIEPPNAPVSRVGDLWRLGDHLLLCGDSTKAESYDTLLCKERIDAIFTDCPWNIPIAGFVSGLGKVKHDDFAMGAGEMSGEEFAAFCNQFHSLGADRLKDGAVFFSCIDWRSVDIIMDAGRKAGLVQIGTAVWDKGSGGMGTPYRSAHELIVIFRKGAKLAVNNVELGKHGRDRTNIRRYPGANRPGSSAAEALKHHPTPKPVALVEDALKDVTKRGAIVLDCFMGSGTTLLAAERARRQARGIELHPAYVDVAIRRWEAMTGQSAVHVGEELTFNELADNRAEPAS